MIQQIGVQWGDISLAEPAIASLVRPIRRGAIARPLPDNHPFFTGSNPAFAGLQVGGLDSDGDGIGDWLDVDSNGDGMLDNVDGDQFVDVPLTRGPWDVDNDRDGVQDSMWVDLGSPVLTTADGRRYKPLYAIMCVDMDGRANLNAHGTRELLSRPADTAGVYIESPLDDSRAPGHDTSTGSLIDDLPTANVGQGYGPAEIRLDRVLQTPAPAFDLYAQILANRTQPKHGFASVTQGMLVDPSLFPGTRMLPGPFGPNARDDIQKSLVHNWGLPTSYVTPGAPSNYAGLPNLYRSPQDLAGTATVYLDHAGQPIYRLQQADPTYTVGLPYPWQPKQTALPVNFPLAFPPENAANAVHNPYAVDLVSGTGNDRLFGDTDLEQLLRYNDIDMRDVQAGNLIESFGPMGQQMLQGLAPALPNEQFAWSRRFTTRSFDIPVPNVVVTDQEERAEIRQQAWEEYNRLRVAMGRVKPLPIDELRLTSTSLTELLSRRLQKAHESANGVDLNTDAATRIAWESSFLQPQLRLMLPPEIRQGRKFDINRPLGNAVDDNLNGVVDEPGEVETAMWAGTVYETPSANTFLYSLFNEPYYDAARTPLENGNFARQRFARHLFCLAMLALDDNFEIDDTNREATVRRIAQWAINVVDNRDPDAIMTPFEYDSDPFDDDGWAVDGYVDTTDGVPDRRVVWGSESPELLITETLAFHDRGLADRSAGGDRFPTENSDADTMNDITDVADSTGAASSSQVDNDLDQVQIPQGSLFLELYATGSRMAPLGSRPFELYHTSDRSQASQELNLAATSEDGNSAVWRIALVQPPTTLDPANLTDEENAVFGPQWINKMFENDELNLALNQEDMATADLNGQGRPDRQLSYVGARYILFTPNVPTMMPASTAYYVNQSANTHIVPGGYAVLGPRAITRIGDDQELDLDLTVGSNNVIHGSASSSSTFWDIRNNNYRDETNTDRPGELNATSANSPPLRNFVIAHPDGPAGWTSTPPRFADGVGISVSEPLPASYYGEPETDLTYLTPRDRPSDFAAGRPLAQLLDDAASDDMHGTYPRFRIALLQRLANPLLPWNAQTNPYVTVDSQMIDLTVFNSAENGEPAGWADSANPHSGTPYMLDPNVETDVTVAPGLELFARSRERGQQQETVKYGPNLWSPLSPEIASEAPSLFEDTFPDATGMEMLTVPSVPDAGALTGNWPYRFRHSLGALNSTYTVPVVGTRLGVGPRSASQLSEIPAGSPYVGAPVRPTTIWMNWLDRPYVSHLELMQVPSSAPWRLPFETRRFDIASNDVNEEFHRDFAHLMNFFYNDPTGDDPNFAAMLDWMEVPSRYVGTRSWLNPRINFAAPTTPMPPEIVEFVPPFNTISAFRDPGKININTIPDARVWEAVDTRNAAATWNKIQQSLAGSANVGNRPAFYGNPVRAAGSPPLMDDPSITGDDPERISSSDATLLRRDPNNDNRFLFEAETTDADAPGDLKEANNPIQQPYFKYQRLQRLGNLLTTHSNVYGVWITVGYFEVYPWNPSDPYLTSTPPLPRVPDEAHPDGWQLGPELGYETGEIERHRAFYLIDRSIPVGFQPGEDLNADKAILLKRMIE